MNEHDMKSLDRQVVVVTGAGRGIGQAIAIRCAEAGAKVAIASRTDPELQDTSRRIQAINAQALIVPTDVTDQDQVKNLFNKTEEELGPVDLLVNNAGALSTPGPTWEKDPDDWWNDVSVNLKGVFMCSHSALKRMIAKQSGRIVNMVGGGTATPFPYASAYAASKAAVMRFTETLAEELANAGHQVKTFALSPGFVKTAMTEPFKDTEEGAKWMSGLKERMEQGGCIPPEHAGDMVVEIGSGRLDMMHGKYLSSEKDHGQAEELATCGKAEEDEWRTLRMQR